MTRLDYLQDQYEDAYFALLMHEVAEQEGMRLEKLNEELQNNPAVAVPEKIDRKCLKTIDQYFAQKRRADHWRTSKKILSRVGIVAAIVMLLFTTAFALSEEFRVTTLNLLITIEEKYTELHMEEAEDPTANSASVTADTSTSSDYFDDLEIGWIPEGFTCILNYPNETIGFENEQGQSFIIDRTDGYDSMNIDTENADKIEYISINGIDSMRVFKEDDINTIIMDTAHNIFVRVWTSAGISVAVNEKIAENIKYIG